MTTLTCSQGHFNPLDSRFCRLCGELLSGKSGSDQLLAWRYRVLSELGKGGFGHTYLAEDTNRFNESCVLKEFAPQVEGAQALQKAEELFAREAGILYQLQHPQIPRFRELFRAEWQGRDRLFLVQDYVAGPTYEELLKQRIQQGDRFTEAEIVQLWLHLLPVLEYIHSLGVIHRDISPDNLIQRSPDGLPVLIDFGGVKQVAARMVSEMAAERGVQQIGTVTRLGKVGYAPAEQLELGAVFPHSDLYALAVTSLVLLTGQEPADLFSHNGAFNRNHWQQQVALRPALIAIIARMLEPYPEKRYQSAQAVMQALSLASHSDRGQSQAKPAANVLVQSVATQAATIAVSPKPLPHPPAKPAPVTLPRGVKQAIANTLLIGGLVAGGWWVGVKWIGPALAPLLPEITKPSPSKPPKTKPNRATSSKPPSSTLASVEQERKQQIATQRQQLGIEDGFLMQLVNAAFYAKHPTLKGQKLGSGAADADLRQEWDELALTTLKRLEAISPDARSRLGRYTMADVQARQTAVNKLYLSGRALNDLTDGAFFHLFPEQPRGDNLLNQPIGQVWQAVADDQLQALQAGKTLEQIEFAPDHFSDRRTGTLQPGQGKAYIANLTANQAMRLQVQPADRSVLLSFYPPTSDRPPLLADSYDTEWSGKLPSSGFYEIVVVADGKSTRYAIDLAVADQVSRSLVQPRAEVRLAKINQ